MHRIARLTLAAALAAALAGTPVAAVERNAGSSQSAPSAGLVARLLAPLRALFGTGHESGPAPRSAADAAEQDGGPNNDPDGLANGADHDPDGPTAGTESESDGGSQNDPDG